MQIDLIFQKKNEEPPAILVRQLRNVRVLDWLDIPRMTMVLNEGGMKSGEPAVTIISQHPQMGAVMLATSLDKFLTAGSGMASYAENQWGWKRPDGHATIMPPDRETRKALLESIKKELEEWDDVDGS